MSGGPSATLSLDRQTITAHGTTIAAMDGRHIGQIVPLLLQFHRETTYQEEPATDQSMLARILSVLLMQPDRYGLFVAEQGGVVVGFCFGSVGPAHVFLPRVRLAAESAWWVAPPYRGTSVGARLLARFRQWGTAQEAHVLSYGKPLTTTRRLPGTYREEIVRTRIGGTSHVR